MRRAKHTQPNRKQHPRCPRCGYDVSGDCDRWKEQCPLEGTCPECGLVFEWRYLLNPALAAPAWLFDTNTSRFWVPLVKTLLRSMWPPGIAKALRIEQEFRLKRSLMLFGVCVLLVHVTAMVCGTLLALSVDHSGGGMFQSIAEITAQDLDIPHGALLRHIIWPYGHVFYTWDWYPLPAGVALLLTLLWASLVPAAFVPLSESLAFARVRSAHLARIAAYSVPAIAALLAAAVVIRTIAIDADWVTGWWYGWPWWIVDGRRTYQAVTMAGGTVLLFWWIWATARYMRMPHALGVAIAVVIMSFLFAVLLMHIAQTDVLGEVFIS